MQLRETLSPFSHVPGSSCMVPRSSWKVTAYPTRLILTDLESENSKIYSLNVTGPMERFTLMQDLKRHFVRIFFTAKEGYFSLRLFINQNALALLLERSPDEGLRFGDLHLKRKDVHVFFPVNGAPACQEKIHFGCHKKQDWTLVCRRQRLDEILPLWFALGQNSPVRPAHEEGTAQLLSTCQNLIEANDRLKIGPAFLHLFRAGFEGILTPRLVDADYQGIIPYGAVRRGSPLTLLSEGAKLIRRLFIEQKGDILAILPCLPIELHAGKLSAVQVSSALSVDLIWSKKKVRILALHAHEDQILKLELQKGIRSFRFEKKHLSRETPLALQAGKTYILDRFEN